MENEQRPIEPDIIEDDALDIRRPDVPVTVEEIAALGEKEAEAVIKSRVQIIETLRAASIRSTHPSDWVLNKDRDGRVIGYLEDKGCQRLMDLWGIELSNLTAPEKIVSEDGKSYAYSMMGDATCKVTRRTVKNMEGIRYSTEKYAQEKAEGIQRDVAVRKAARANLEGRCVRNLAGLNGVPLEELIQKSGDKNFEKNATKGHGYGTAGERRGTEGSDHGIAPADYPICDACVALNPPKTTTMVYKKDGKKGPVWYCPNWKAHEKVASFIDHADLVARLEKEKGKAEAPREPGADG